MGTREFRHCSPLGDWELICRDPDPRLRKYVHEYTGYVERAASFSRRREVPGLGRGAFGGDDPAAVQEVTVGAAPFTG